VYKAKILINRRENIPNPAEGAIKTALHKLEFTNVKNLRIGKHVTFDIDAETEDDAKSQVQVMCEKLLVNPVSENYSMEVNNETN